MHAAMTVSIPRLSMHNNARYQVLVVSFKRDTLTRCLQTYYVLSTKYLVVRKSLSRHMLG